MIHGNSQVTLGLGLKLVGLISSWRHIGWCQRRAKFFLYKRKSWFIGLNLFNFLSQKSKWLAHSFIIYFYIWLKFIVICPIAFCIILFKDRQYLSKYALYHNTNRSIIFESPIYLPPSTTFSFMRKQFPLKNYYFFHINW